MKGPNLAEGEKLAIVIVGTIILSALFFIYAPF